MFPEEQDFSSFEFDAEEILNCIMQDSTDCIVIKDKQGRYIWINEAGALFLDRQIEEVIGKTDFELFDREAAFSIRKSDMEVMSRGLCEVHEAFLKPISAKGRQFKAIKRAYKNSSGQVQGIINIVRENSPVQLQAIEA